VINCTGPLALIWQLHCNLYSASWITKPRSLRFRGSMRRTWN